ncbi:DUF3383 family protein [Lacticaseibacillus saniviri]
MAINSLSDVEVSLTVQQPASPFNLGTLAIFMPGTANSSKTYLSIDDLSADIESADALSVARGYFAQAMHSKTLYVITYADLTTALDTYFVDNWEFAVLVANGTDHPVKDGDTMILSNYVEGKARRFYVAGLPATDETVTMAETIKQQFFGNQRTIVFASGADVSGANYGIGALIGALGNQTVGSITWKFKNLVGVKAASYNAAQVDKFHKNGIFTYVKKAGIEQTSEGFTVSGEFIDSLHGDDWIKASLESDLQKLLSTSPKISFDGTGISQLEATATAVMLQATANGVILINDKTGAGEYTVTAKPRAETSAEDIAQRHYSGLSFTYRRSGAIHSVTVRGTVLL